MSQALVDDDLWTRIEPLLPKRRPRNRQHAGRRPIPDRAVLTGILFCAPERHPLEDVAEGNGLWLRQYVLASVGPQATRRGLEAAPSGVTERIASARPARSRAGRRRQRLAPRLARGKKLDRTLPIAVRPGRTSCSYRRPRDSGCRAPHVGEPARRDPVAAARRRHSAAARLPGSAAAQAGACPRRPRVRFATASRGTSAPRDRDSARETRAAARQRAGPHALGRRAYPRLAPSLSSAQSALRASALRA